MKARKVGDRVSLQPLGLKGTGTVTAIIVGAAGPTTIVRTGAGYVHVRPARGECLVR